VVEVNGIEHTYLFAEWEQYAKKLKKIGSNYKVKVYLDEEELQNPQHQVHIFGFEDEKNSNKDWFITSLSPVDRAVRDKASQNHTDLKVIGQMDRLRKDMQDKHNRKSLESAIYALQCKLYGEDAAEEEQPNASPKELRKKLQSLEKIASEQGKNIIQTPKQLYQSAFENEDAIRMRKLAERELIQDRNLTLALSLEERQSAKDTQKQHLEALYKKRTGK
jgi:hypothetical protein